MQLMNSLIFHLLPSVDVSLVGSLSAVMEQIRSRLIAFFRELYTTIGIQVLREFSQTLEHALQHPGAKLLNDHLAIIVLPVSLLVGTIATLVLWRMSGAGIRLNRAAFETVQKDAAKSSASTGQTIAGYFRCLVKAFLEAFIVFFCILAVTTILFLFCKLLWFSYLASPVGRFYPVYFPQRARLIGMVLEQDMLTFPLVLNMITFGAGGLCAAISRFFHLTRYLYLSRGGLGRILLFAVPINVLAATVLRLILPHPHWGAAYATALIPTLLSFGFCFRLAIRVVPEMGYFLQKMTRSGNGPMHAIYLQNLNSEKTVLEFDPLSGRRTGKQFSNMDGVQPQGQFLLRHGHEFILYRYGRAIFFQVDNLELPLRIDMTGKLIQKGRRSHRFELFSSDVPLFRLNWSAIPLLGAAGPTTVFFKTMQSVLASREAYENTFIAEDDQDAAEYDCEP